MKNKGIEIKANVTVPRVTKFIKLALFIGMLILIFVVSPRITTAIQNGAKYISEVDCNFITRIVVIKNHKTIF